MEGVYTLALKFTSAYKKTPASFIDPESPVTELVKDFVVGYSMVRHNEKAVLTRLLTKVIALANGEKHLDAEI